MTDIPKFETRADQDEWFVQQGLINRIKGGIPESEKRGCLKVSPYFRVYVGESDGDELDDLITTLLLNQKEADGEYQASLNLTGAWGRNYVHAGGGGLTTSAEIIAESRRMFSEAAEGGYLKPRDIQQDNTVIRKYAANSPS